VFVGGSPFIYLADELSGNYRNKRRSGTLLFPPHSTPHVRLAFDLETYLDELTSLPGEFHPLTACLHPNEFGSEFATHIRARGIAVVTNGSTDSDSFLKAFISHAASAKYATAPAMCTAIAYCAFIGTGIFLLGPNVGLVNLTDPHDRPGALSLGETQEELRSRLTVERADDLEAQKAMADDLLGAVFKLEPAEIREAYWSSYRRIGPRRFTRLGIRKLARKLRP
jgi:hypothetical protein